MAWSGTGSRDPRGSAPRSCHKHATDKETWSYQGTMHATRVQALSGPACPGSASVAYNVYIGLQAVVLGLLDF